MSNDQASPTGGGKQTGGPPPPKNDGAHGSKPVDPSKPTPHPIAGNPSVPAAPDGVDAPDAGKSPQDGSA